MKLLNISDGHTTCDLKDSEVLFDGCHILLNGLCGLELQGVELIRCLPDVAVLCAVDVIIDCLEPLDRIVVGNHTLDQIM